MDLIIVHHQSCTFNSLGHIPLLALLVDFAMLRLTFLIGLCDCRFCPDLVNAFRGLNPRFPRLHPNLLDE